MLSSLHRPIKLFFAAPLPLCETSGLVRRGRGYRDMNYLLLKAQRLAATKTQFLVLQKAA